MKRPNVTRRSAVLLCVLAFAWVIARADNDERCENVPQYGPWSAPVNLGPPVNTSFAEVNPTISKDGLSLYFSCQDCPGGYGGFDLWVSHRPTVDNPWGAPENLGPIINTPMNETNPALSEDGHRLYFTSNRSGGYGATDLYVSRRHNKRDDLSWQPPENLGSGVNTTADDRTSTAPFEDEKTGTITIYFSSNRAGGPGGDDLYSSTLQSDETFGPPELIAELSTAFTDRSPGIRRDGLEMFFVSNRPGSVLNAQGKPSADIWVSTRVSTEDPWTPPVNLGATVNYIGEDSHPSLSLDGTTLYFDSAFRPGNIGGSFFDIWMIQRERIRPAKHRDEDDEECEHNHRHHHGQ